MTEYRLGFHRNFGGDSADIGPLNASVTQLAAAGQGPFVVVIGEGGHAAQLSDAGAEVAFAIDSWRAEPPYDSGQPEQDGRERWLGIRSMMPPEIAARRDKIWIIPLNEPRQEAADYVHRFMVALAQAAKADRYKVAGPSWSTGTPRA